MYVRPHSYYLSRRADADADDVHPTGRWTSGAKIQLRRVYLLAQLRGYSARVSLCPYESDSQVHLYLVQGGTPHLRAVSTLHTGHHGGTDR